jgi:RNA polymerase sigma-70 factor (ECF subfamily)
MSEWDRRGRGTPSDESHPAPAPSPSDPYEDLRPRLISIAYRMVGSYSEAEDLVQEAFVRFHQATRRGTEIESAKAFLTTVTTRLAIDHHRAARVRRETYVGPWLPDPLVDEMAPDIAETAELAESLSTAFLVLLETLSPRERAVFLLHDVFDYDYPGIAEVVGTSEANCRQIATRARRRIAIAEPRFETSTRERDRLAERFLAASRRGDVEALVAMLADDATFVGDGGAKGNGLAGPVVGRERVGRLVAGFTRRMGELGISLQPVHVGAQPAVLLVDPEGRVGGVWSLHVVDGVVREIHGVVNPDKLGHLGVVSPLAFRATREDGTDEDEQREQPEQREGEAHEDDD